MVRGSSRGLTHSLARTDRTARYLECDAGVAEQVERSVAQATAQLGGLTCLVNVRARLPGTRRVNNAHICVPEVIFGPKISSWCDEQFEFILLAQKCELWGETYKMTRS